MLKLCLIGCRGHWRYGLDDLPRLPQVQLAALSSGCADAPDRIVKAAADLGRAPKVYADWREMLEQERPELVSIDGPFKLHAEMCVFAIEHGINVLCEKPIALTLPDLERIENALKAHPVKLASMVKMRYLPHFYYAHKLVEAGRIGKVKLIQTQKSYKLGNRPEYYKTRAEYGGTIGWVGSHALDWTMWFAASGFASVWATQTREDNGGNGELEIAAQCVFKMKNGVLAESSIEFLRPAGAPTHGDDRIRVAGTSGVIEVRQGKVFLTDAEGERELPVPEPDRFLMVDLVEDVLGVRPGLVSARETIDLTRACLLAQKAADENRIVAIP